MDKILLIKNKHGYFLSGFKVENDLLVFPTWDEFQGLQFDPQDTGMLMVIVIGINTLQGKGYCEIMSAEISQYDTEYTPE